MRKLGMICLVLLIALSLCACGRGIIDVIGGGPQSDPPLSREDDPSESPAAAVSQTDAVTSALDGLGLDSILAGFGGTDTVIGSLSEEDKQRILDLAKENGMDASFDENGRFVITGKDGNGLYQNEDGSWTVANESGTVGQFGGEWPENVFTQLVPKPPFKLFGSSTSEDGFNVAFSGATVEQVRAYAEELKKAGFNVDADTQDREVMGIAVYSYSAENAAGFSVSLSMTSGVCALAIQKP